MNASARFSEYRDFLLIWFGQLISGVGSRLTSFALGLWVYRTTGSTTLYALIFVSMAVPALVLSPLAGVLVDRWDRRRTMIACETFSAVIIAALALLVFSGHLRMWHIYAGVGLTAVANAFLQPAYAASVPLLVKNEQLTRMNGLIQTGQALALVGGPSLASILTYSVGVWTALAIDAASFVVGAILLAMARVPRPAEAATDVAPNLWHEAREGWRYIAESRGLFGLLMVFGVNNFLFGIASIAIFPLVLSVATPDMVGVQMSIGCSGLLLGGLLISTWGGPRRKIDGVLGFSLLCGLGLAAHGLSPSFWLLSIAGFFTFATMPVMNATNASLWQSKVPSHLLGRSFAILRVMSEAAMPVGYLLAGPLAEFVFEPLMAPNGALAGSVGAVIGTGPGRGLALMFVLLGVAMLITAAAGYGVRSIRRVEEELPDAPMPAMAT